ncbi:MAG: hypothetical protein AB8B87_17045 [Granulosicoccus sp.]
MGVTLWGKVVLDGDQPGHGNSCEEVLSAFPDAQLILSNGCEACACATVLWDGQAPGDLSLIAARHCYTSDDLSSMSLIAQTLAPALLIPVSPGHN